MSRAASLPSLILAWIVTLPLVLCPCPADAHARLVRSRPASQALVLAAPDRVELWFSELLEDGFNSVEVVRVGELAARGRTNMTRGAATVDRDDRTHLVILVRPLPPGPYAVEWRVLSRDGHSAAGRFTFDVRPSP